MNEEQYIQWVLEDSDRATKKYKKEFDEICKSIDKTMAEIKSTL